MKKFLLTGSFISLCLLSTAKADTQRPSFNGFYAGFGVGFNRADAVINNDFTVNQTLNTIIPAFAPASFSLPLNIQQTNESVRQYKNSPLGDILLGYGHQWGKRYYMGVEAFANLAQRRFASASQEVTNNGALTLDTLVINFNTTAQSTNQVKLNPFEYGADLRLGVIADNLTTLLYGKIGAAFNKISLTSNTSTTANFVIPEITFTSPTIISSASDANSQQVVGIRLGLGIEQLISCHWSLRADYTYTDYGSVRVNTRGDVSGFSQVFFPDDPDNTTTVNIASIPSGIAQNAGAHLRSNALTLGLSYYF